MRTNIITAVVNPANDVTVTTPIYRPDYGQMMLISGLELPTAYQVFFANSNEYSDTAKGVIGDVNGVEIPTEYISSGQTVYAWLFLHTGTDDGEVTHRFILPNMVTPEFTDEVPTPAQQSEIDQAIAALNLAVETTEGYADDAQSSAEAAEASAIQSAQSATDAAQSAQDADQSADTATAAAESARTSEFNAEAEAERAEAARDAAQGYANDADQSADDAEQSAERAEQAAAQSGYMWFEIGEDGHLYMERTPNTQVTFELGADGHLYVKEAV